jgi:hypothetical protein
MRVFKHKLIVSNKLRKISKIINLFSFCMILLYTLLLCLDSPLSQPASGASIAIDVFDALLTVFFIFEAACKMVAFGIFSNSYRMPGYFANYWNIIDFVILLGSIGSLIIRISAPEEYSGPIGTARLFFGVIR